MKSEYRTVIKKLEQLGYGRYSPPGPVSWILFIIKGAIDALFGMREIAAFRKLFPCVQVSATSPANANIAGFQYWVYIHQKIRGSQYHFVEYPVRRGKSWSGAERKVKITSDPTSILECAYLAQLQTLKSIQGECYQFSPAALQTDYLAYFDEAAWLLRAAQVFKSRGAILAHPDLCKKNEAERKS